jgi:hypothetical protein
MSMTPNDFMNACDKIRSFLSQATNQWATTYVENGGVKSEGVSLPAADAFAMKWMTAHPAWATVQDAMRSLADHTVSAVEEANNEGRAASL